jgi:hypothetical protein
MKKLILLLIILFSLNAEAQPNRTCYMYQGQGIASGNLLLARWSNRHNGKQKFYFDIDNKKLYVFDYGSSDWILVDSENQNTFITPNIQQVAEVGNGLNILPLNFTNGDNSSSINGNNVVFYSPSGTAQYNGGAMQIYSNNGKYIKLDPQIGLFLKTNTNGLNGGSELILKSDNLTDTRFQQAADVSGIVPVIKYVNVGPTVNDIGVLGEIRIKNTAMYIWTNTGWKSTTLN